MDKWQGFVQALNASAPNKLIQDKPVSIAANKATVQTKPTKKEGKKVSTSSKAVKVPKVRLNVATESVFKKKLVEKATKVLSEQQAADLKAKLKRKKRLRSQQKAEQACRVTEAFETEAEIKLRNIALKGAVKFFEQLAAFQLENSSSSSAPTSSPFDDLSVARKGRRYFSNK